MLSKNEKTASFHLRGVGEQTAKMLARLEIFSVTDLLFHLPIRYEDRTKIQPICQLIRGAEAVIEGVVKIVSSTSHGRTKLLCELKDGTGTIHLRFFYLLSFQMNILKSGVRLRCYGEIRLGPKGLEMIHPEYQVITEGKEIPVSQYLTPVYPSTEGLSQNTLRKLMSNALAWMEKEKDFDEIIPLSILQAFSFPTLREALSFIHRPPATISMTELVECKTPAQQRLIFEELLAHRLSLLNLKSIFQLQRAPSLVKTEKLIPSFLKQLPFELTSAQQRAWEAINHDLKKTHPMLRLLQGDVGSGKTVVAALAILQTVENGYQAAMMAPTELLAEQHYRVLKNWLEPLGVKVTYLSGSIQGNAKIAALNAIANGEAHVILGTHALFQGAVNFSNLALVVVDEQHRFGVQQRALLREKGVQAAYYPHQLVMTATPIPRTLAMSFYADLDCSTIDELPPGRTPVTTSAIANIRRSEVIMRIRNACHQGRQAYWVCPLIDESEINPCESAIKTTEQLQKLLPSIKIGLIHGRMSSNEKEMVMRAFQQGEIQLLVATTVIEVGVDVPNSSLMIIENAERLGLAQLHQLRGRVGRSSIASHCVLLYQQPLSALAKERLSVMRETNDGFKIAQRDLELRGPGEVLGTRQTGALTFHIADLLRDSGNLADVHKAAEVIIQDHKDIIDVLIKRWVGQGNDYGKV